MPWSIDDVDKHHKGLSAAKKRQWVAVANSSYKKCMAEGGMDATCAPKAIRQANGVVNNSVDIISMAHSEYVVRNETHQGRPYVVVPCVMMTEGVHSGSRGPLFHPADELGRFVQAWNGIPVVIHHPENNGIPVSANSPDIVDQQVVGRVYNAQMDGPRLRGEVWIDIGKLQEVNLDALNVIQQQQPMDVSVGVFSEEDDIAGEWNGEAYIGTARGHRPDHLALLPGGIGACSWSDGCGLRANKAMSGAAINDLPDSAFAYIESGGSKDEQGKTTPRSLRHFPVHDAAHARNALARASQSPFGKKAMPKIRAACKKFGIEMSDNEEGGEVTLPEPEDNKPVAINIDESMKRLLNEGYFVMQAAVGYRQKMECIQGKLDRMDDDVKVHFLQDVFDDYFVYEIRGRAGGTYNGSGIYKRNYTVDANGAVEFTGEPREVHREVQYVENKKEGGTEVMANERKPCCPQKVKLLIESEHTPYQETDREFLESLDEIQINKLVDMEGILAKEPEPVKEPEPIKEPDPVKEPEPVTNEKAIQVLRESLKTPEEFIAVMPEDMREQMNSGLKMYRDERTKLIEAIKASSRFTDELLNAKTMTELGILADMVKPKDYSGLGGGAPVVNNADNLLLPTGFGIKKEGGK